MFVVTAVALLEAAGYVARLRMLTSPGFGTCEALYFPPNACFAAIFDVSQPAGSRYAVLRRLQTYLCSLCRCGHAAVPDHHANSACPSCERLTSALLPGIPCQETSSSSQHWQFITPAAQNNRRLQGSICTDNSSLLLLLQEWNHTSNIGARCPLCMDTHCLSRHPIAIAHAGLLDCWAPHQALQHATGWALQTPAHCAALRWQVR